MRTRENVDSGSFARNGQFHSEHRRERILTVLENQTLPLSLSELADAVADRADPSDPQTTRGDIDADCVRIRLHHVDLPRLHDQGVLEYDATRNVVSDYFGSENN